MCPLRANKKKHSLNSVGKRTPIKIIINKFKVELQKSDGQITMLSYFSRCLSRNQLDCGSYSTMLSFVHMLTPNNHRISLY